MTMKYRIADASGLINNEDPRKIIRFWDDFLGYSVSATAGTNPWLATVIGAASAATVYAGVDASQELTGGWVALTPDATAADTVNLTLQGQMFQIDQGKPLYFEARIYTPDISDIDGWVGLTGSSPDTEIIAGGINDAAMGFEWTGADGILAFVTDQGGSEKTAATGDVMADGDIWKLAMYYDGADTIYFYTAECSASEAAQKSKSGELVCVGTRKLSTTADYCPEDKMLTPTIEAQGNPTGACDPLCVDYVLCVQQRTQTLE